MPNLTLDLRYLRCALAVAELGSFRRAAAAIELPQSSVSRRIQLLERRLGFALFVRSRRGTRSTTAGAEFLKAAVVGAHQLDQAARLAAAAHRGERGEIRIGIRASVVSGFLHEVLRCFRNQYPAVRVSLWEGMPLETLHGVAMGELDISFVIGCPDIPGCNTRFLCNESIYVALPTGHHLADRTTINWDEISEETFVVSRSGPGIEIQDYVIGKLSRPGFRPRIDVHDVSIGSLFDLVAIDYGVALTSTSSFRGDIDGVVFRLITGEADVLPSSAVWSADNVNPAVAHFLRLAESVANRTAGAITK